MLFKKFTILLFFSLLFIQGFAQRASDKVLLGNEVKVYYQQRSPGTIFITVVYNEDYKCPREILIDKNPGLLIKKGGSLAINKECYSIVKAHNTCNGYRETLWAAPSAPVEDRKPEAKDMDEEISESASTPERAETPTRNDEETFASQPKAARNVMSEPQIKRAFEKMLEEDAFYSSSFLQELNKYADEQVYMISYLKDAESRERYIEEKQIREYIRKNEGLIDQKEADMEGDVGSFLDANFGYMDVSSRSDCEDDLKNLLEDRITQRRNALDKLRSEIGEGGVVTTVVKNAVRTLFSGTSIAINILVGLLIVALGVSLAVLLAKKRNKKKVSDQMRTEESREEAKSNIVVRRKTTSILKKQSLEDVQHNPAYLPLDCADFCADSAVRRIYFKNTCVKEIYNLYAEDLRNPENPNEDGCMVLGRWVHDAENDEYYVSLEEIVKPGDDAVFKEYELNFGGKIKLKVSERLRRLRRETNLQYDMTCWVHSHPGLGVFFSNADSSVQMQLKHPTHPKFLIAIVIDILTPDQELGIFTFKHDMTINSKADLVKMYSLEDLHKWAVESDRTSFKAEDFRNIMQTASQRIDSHFGIELSNGAIIDMCQLQTEQASGVQAWVHGYVCQNNNGKSEYLVKSVALTKQSPENDLIGCFISDAHCSIPTIRKIIANDYQNVKFILFYSAADDMLTAIPVVGNQVSVDERCYGEEKLEELKIWTRRKR